MSEDPTTGGRRDERFLEEVRARRERRERAAREGDDSFWPSVGMMGTIGWSVSVPTAAGALIGRWLDRRLDSAHIFLVFCMLLGLIVGCVTAWRAVARRL